MGDVSSDGDASYVSCGCWPWPCRSTLSGSHFHSQWEIYSHSLPSLMSILRNRWRASATPAPALAQFIYGWDRWVSGAAAPRGRCQHAPLNGHAIAR